MFHVNRAALHVDISFSWIVNFIRMNPFERVPNHAHTQTRNCLLNGEFLWKNSGSREKPFLRKV